MLTGDIGETALLARHGRLDSAAMRLFHPLKFMLATAAEDLTDVARQMPTGFVVEDKFDGIRAQAHVAPAAAGPDNENAPPLLHGVVHESGVRVALFSRTLDEVTHRFADLIGPLAGLATHAGLLLDGEIVPIAPPAATAMTGRASCPFRNCKSGWAAKRCPPNCSNRSPSPLSPTTCCMPTAACCLTSRSLSGAKRGGLDHGRASARAGPRRKHMDDIAGLDAEFEAAPRPRQRGADGQGAAVGLQAGPARARLAQDQARPGRRSTWSSPPRRSAKGGAADS
jgi:hypothetical protein